jgi:Icc-related predicted phosphoesterase
VIRVAAVGDVHFGLDSGGLLRAALERLAEQADVLLLAGDLTTCGDPEEASVLAAELRDLSVPVVAVLGNHDYHSGREAEVRARLERGGIRVLEGEAETIEVGELRLSVAGVKGFMGGFAGACGTEFGEQEMKEFIRVTQRAAARLEELLAGAGADVRVALMHYAPVKGTLLGERLELYPFLGSYLLAEAVDRAGADLVLHGHAHGGTEKAATPGGIHVRNVAQPVIRHAYNVYALGASREAESPERREAHTAAEPTRF